MVKAKDPYQELRHSAFSVKYEHVFPYRLETQRKVRRERKQCQGESTDAHRVMEVKGE